MLETYLFSRIAVALAIGLMVGVERRWQARDAEDHGRAAGLRTFGLSGLMGGICGVLADQLGPQFVGIAFLAFTAGLGAFSWLEAKARGSASATSLIAGMLTFLLGAMATLGDVTVAIAAAVSMTVLLALRTQLHSWLAAITWEEIRADLIPMVIPFLLLQLLPDWAIDSWATVNLHEVWLLAIMASLISFTGYAAVHVFGDRLGIIVTAAAGGLASSTATTLTFARLGREQASAVNLLIAGCPDQLDRDGVLSQSLALAKLSYCISLVKRPVPQTGQKDGLRARSGPFGWCCRLLSRPVSPKQRRMT
jgi:uncharacterized membrane protein (DUF4010 family)